MYIFLIIQNFLPYEKVTYRILSNCSAGRVKMKGGRGASNGMFWMTFFKDKVPPSPPSPPSLVSFRVPWLGYIGSVAWMGKGGGGGGAFIRDGATNGGNTVYIFSFLRLFFFHNI